MILKRIEIFDNEIIGELYSDNMFLCNTLENRKKALYNGKYEITLGIMSPKFKTNLPRLIVENRRGILIHAGNTYKDTEGCILVGMWSGGNKIYNSRICLEKVIKEIKNKKINKITICTKK